MPLFPLLAVAEQTVNNVLGGVERISSWSDHALVILLVVVLCGGAALLLRISFRQTAQERAGREAERKEYIDSLKSIAAANAVALDRNSAAFSRLEGLREAFDRMAAAVSNLVPLVTKLDLDWRLERRTDAPRIGPNQRRDGRDE